MAFPQAWLDELMAKNDIVTVISRYMDLKPKGRKLWGLCPFHGEKTASFSVSPDKQLFYCFGCHIGGNVITFVKEIEHLSFAEAVRVLAESCGMSMPEDVDDAQVQRDRARKERLKACNKAAARFFMQSFISQGGKKAQQYFASRGINAEIVKRFGLGYAPDSWDSLKNSLFEQGFSQKELIDAGLLVHNAEKDSSYDRFRDRVMFPIISENGTDVLAFGGRIIGPMTEKSGGKYLNTNETPIYVKGDHLYGLCLQRNAKPESLIVVEGYMDVIGLYKAGVTNVVASLGTALTVKQARLLKRYTSRVFIAYDGDSAGQNGMIRGLEILRDEGLDVRVIVFPDNLDPDEYIKKEGRDAFESLKDAALSVTAFKLEAMAKKYDLRDENRREAFAKEACAMIAALPPIEQKRYYQLLAKKTGYDAEDLAAQGNTADTASFNRPRRTAVRTTPIEELMETPRLNAEKGLLRAMLASQEAAVTVLEQDGMNLFGSDEASQLAAAVIGAYSEGRTPNGPQIINTLPEEKAHFFTAILQDESPITDSVRMAKDCMETIRRYDREQTMAELSLKLTNKSLPEAERKEIMQRITELRRGNVHT